MTKLSIHIPKPCSENWQEMYPTQHGRFCLHCEKKIIDFTKFSDKERLAFFQNNNQKTCGRFHKNQVDRPIIPAQTFRQKPYVNYWFGISVSVLTLLVNQSFGKTSKDVNYRDFKPTMSISPSSKEHFSTNSDSTKIKPWRIQGKVIYSTTKKSIAGVSIKIDGKQQTVTDSLGKFSLMIDKKEITVKFESIGFGSISKTYSYKAKSSIILLNYPMTFKYQYMLARLVEYQNLNKALNL